jgi:hypothetical protein
MPVNPSWWREGLVLALDLYLRHGLLDRRRTEVVRLSGLLNALPIADTNAPTRTTAIRAALV